MTDSTDAVDARLCDIAEVVEVIGGKLAAAGIGVDDDIIESERGACGAEVPLMGPYGVEISAGGFAKTSIEHEHLVDLAIAVPVVILEIHDIINGLTGFFNHLLRMLVIATRIVLSIIGHLLFKGNGTYHIEVELKAATALRLEVVAHRTSEIAFTEVLFVGDTLKESRGVAFLKLQVFEFSKDDDALLLAFVHHSGTAYLAAGQTRVTNVVSLGTVNTRLGLQLFHIHLDGEAALHGVSFSLCRLIVVSMLITYELYSHLTAVGCCDLFVDTTLGRYCQHDVCHCKE